MLIFNAKIVGMLHSFKVAVLSDVSNRASAVSVLTLKAQWFLVLLVQKIVSDIVALFELIAKIAKKFNQNHV